MTETEVDIPLEDRDEFEKVLTQLEESAFAGELQKDPKWQIFFKACDNIKKRSQEQLAKASPDDKTNILWLQMLIAFYENPVSSIIEEHRRVGEDAYEKARFNGWLPSIARWLKNF